MICDVDEKYIITDKNINNKHDKIFRTILSDEAEATEIINTILNKKYTIKPEMLEKYNSSFITRSFENRESDIVYKLKHTNIFFLIEHQTKIDYLMSLRMLDYQVEIMRCALSKGVNFRYIEIPLVVPIVLYTGDKLWDASISLSECQPQLEGYEKNENTYNLIDINKYSVEDLLQSKSFIKKVMLIEKAKTKEKMVDILIKIIPKVTLKKNRELLIIIIDLTLRDVLGNALAEELIEKIKEGGSKMLAVVERLERENRELINKGRQEGRIESIREMIKAMVEYKIPIKTIEEITKVSKEEIMKIKNKK